MRESFKGSRMVEKEVVEKFIKNRQWKIPAIAYLCPDCSDKLQLTHIKSVYNEVGRKRCYGCDNNNDNLDAHTKEDIEKLIEQYNISRAVK